MGCTAEYGESSEPAYVFDDGDGLKSIPVCYFPASSPVTKDDITSVENVEDAIETLGCQYGFLSFSTVNTEGSAIKSIELFVYHGEGGETATLSDLPRERGGQIVHLTYIDVSIEGEFFDELLGGFDSTIIPWQIDIDVSVVPVSDSILYDTFDTNVGYIDAIAEDLDTENIDFQIFAYEVAIDEEGVNNRVDQERGDTESSSPSLSAVSSLVAVTCGLLSLFGHL